MWPDWIPWTISDNLALDTDIMTVFLQASLELATIQDIIFFIKSIQWRYQSRYCSGRSMSAYLDKFSWFFIIVKHPLKVAWLVQDDNRLGLHRIDPRDDFIQWSYRDTWCVIMHGYRESEGHCMIGHVFLLKSSTYEDLGTNTLDY